ncbi:MAG TPA: hypothetical protein VEZ90_06455 [Blastocatellia bacterium]|nr:hypothetical protein [Blastocatellia bacterium]
MRARSTEGTVDYEGLKCLIGFFRSEDGTSTEVRESVELREIVFHKDVGPAGEKTYRLFNVKRTEPDASLFVIPEGYKVIELRARS